MAPTAPLMDPLKKPAPCEPDPMERLKNRSDFLETAKGQRAPRQAVLIQSRQRNDGQTIRLGFTATKRIGNAVARNRAKRRLRHAAYALVPQFGKSGHDYVFIARPETLNASWQALLDDVKRALIRLGGMGASRDLIVEAPSQSDATAS